MAELEVLRQREMAEKRARALQRGNRHSRFGGSYIVQGLKSIGERDVVFHKGLHNVSMHLYVAETWESQDLKGWPSLELRGAVFLA